MTSSTQAADPLAERAEVRRVRVRYFAGARAAAGVAEETVTVAVGASVEDVLTTVLAEHDDRLARVFTACGFLLDGVAVRDRATRVPEGAELDVLPPFAGG